MKRKPKKQKAPKPAKAKRQPNWSNGIDWEIVRRREDDVARLWVEGMSKREIADELLQQHNTGDIPLFSFRDNEKLTPEERRQRAYDVVLGDFVRFRERGQAGDENAARRLANDRFVMLERLRLHYRELLVIARDGNQDAKDRIRAYSEARETMTLLGHIQGIDTQKVTEVRLPEKYIVEIDEDGIIQKRKVPWDGRRETLHDRPPKQLEGEKPN